MKQLFIILFLVCATSFVACHYERPGFYEGGNYIQFYYDNLVYKDSSDYLTRPQNYPYISSTRLQDTAWFRVQAVGQPAHYDRAVRFEPYVNAADSNSTEAVPGVHYVAFDDPEIQPLMVVPADSVYMDIPVVILYDADTRGSVALNFRLVATDDFEIGMPTLSKGHFIWSNY